MDRFGIILTAFINIANSNVWFPQPYTCGEIITNYFNTSNLNFHHIYSFTVNRQIELNLHTCNTASDIRLIFTKGTGEVYSYAHQYCTNGDGCGRCFTGTTPVNPIYVENFTMPITDFSQNYLIDISPYQIGNYQINIECHDITSTPSKNPTSIPTSNPSLNPTSTPSKIPSANPTGYPTDNPSFHPTDSPFKHSNNPTIAPSNVPTENPTNAPSYNPTNLPSSNPSLQPSLNPTQSKISIPSLTVMPSQNPTIVPSLKPSLNLTVRQKSDKITASTTITILGLNSEMTIVLGVLLIAVCCLLPMCIGIASFCIFKKASEKLPKMNQVVNSNSHIQQVVHMHMDMSDKQYEINMKPDFYDAYTLSDRRVDLPPLPNNISTATNKSLGEHEKGFQTKLEFDLNVIDAQYDVNYEEQELPEFKDDEEYKHTDDGHLNPPKGIQTKSKKMVALELKESEMSDGMYEVYNQTVGNQITIMNPYVTKKETLTSQMSVNGDV